MTKEITGIGALALLSVFVVTAPLCAQLPTFDHAVQLGSSVFETAYDAVFDSVGNVILVGRVDGNAVDFDPGAGVVPVGTGVRSTFVASYDPSGSLNWAGAFVNTGNTGGHSIAVDSSDNVVVTGAFEGTTDFEFGAGTTNLTAAGAMDGYLLRLDNAGAFLDVKHFPAGASNFIFPQGIAVDSQDRIVVCGDVTGMADVDPGAGSATINDGPGGGTAYVAQYDNSGNLNWAAQATTATNGAVGARDLALDSADNIYTSGYLTNTFDFDPSGGTANLGVTEGTEDRHLWKLDDAGNFVWARQIEGAEGVRGDIAVDSQDNVYVAQVITATSDVDPGAGTFNLTPVGGPQDIALVKLDSAGTFVTAGQVGGTSIDRPYGLEFDSSDNLYLTGIIFAAADMDPGAGVANLTPTGAQGFLLKVDSSLGYDDAGALSTDDLTGLATRGVDVVVAGKQLAGGDLDPGPATVTLPHAGDRDFFYTKLLGPVLTITIAEEIPGAEDEEVDVAVDLTTAGEMVAGIAFEVDFDETCLSFDDTGAGIPDDIDVNAANVTGDFTVTATFDGGDTDGELDITISDISPPVATLSDGTLLTITFTADQCSPALGSFTIAPVTFPDPTVSFSDPAALDLTGENEDGSVEVWPAPRGDCNSSGVVSVADLIADGLEIFDSDGTFWADTQDDGFAGSPVGCDANADTTVNAGDISCTVLLIFGGTCGGGAGPALGKAAWGRPQVWINGNQRVSKGDVVYVPVHMRSRGNGLSGLAFSLDIDSSRFGHAERVPLGDLVTYPSGRPMLADVRYDRSDRNGEIDVVLGEDIGRTFGDGVVLQIPLRALRDGRLADGIRFADRPGVSFGNSAGQAVRGFSTVHGGKR